MKAKLLIALIALCGIANAQWASKTPFGGTARTSAIGFSIGTKGYIGTGNNGTDLVDFWEWNQGTNLWTVKAPFPGTPRKGAVCFSIGTKGYVGLGYGGGYLNDFWEYDPATNIWTAKASFPGTARDFATGFSIGSKGYIGTGNHFTGQKQDFYEYDPSTNTWIAKASFPGVARSGATGFSIGSKGYIGIGNGGGSGGGFKQDFYEYDPSTNLWTAKAPFPGAARANGASFSIGTKGYIGTGYDGTYKNDFWEWDQGTNIWTVKAPFPGTGLALGVGFSIGTKGYIGTGMSASTLATDFLEYSPTTTGIVEYKDAFSISIYPNPFSTQTTFQIDKILKDATLTVYDYLGQKVKQIKNISEQTVTLSRDNLASGLYFFSLTEENKVIATDKLVITD